MPVYVPAPRYRMDMGERPAILLNGVRIGFPNPYRSQALGECQKLVEAANVASECRVALKACAAAFLTMEHAGMNLPEPVRRVKDQAFAALAATQR